MNAIFQGFFSVIQRYICKYALSVSEGVIAFVVVKSTFVIKYNTGNVKPYVYYGLRVYIWCY